MGSASHMTTADRKLATSRLFRYTICTRCKTRNAKGTTKCRKCGYTKTQYRKGLRSKKYIPRG